MAGYLFEMQATVGPIDEPISGWHTAICVVLGHSEKLW